MNPFELTEEQFNKLMRLCRLYRREAEKCMKAKLNKVAKTSSRGKTEDRPL